MKTKWNYDMDSCPLDTKVYLLSSNDCPLLPQMEYVGTIPLMEDLRWMESVIGEILTIFTEVQ